MKNKESVKAVVFDFDGVFYRYDSLGGKTFYNLTLEAAARAIKDLSPIVLPKKARRAIAAESYSAFNNQTEYAHRALGIPTDEMHRLYHKYLFGALETHHAHFFEHAKTLTSHFNDVSDSVKMVAILSHASAGEFISPFLQRIGLASRFNGVNGAKVSRTVFGAEEFGTQYMKDIHHEPFIYVEEQLGLKGKEIAFVDDSVGNLIIPREREWRTVWIKRSGHNRDNKIKTSAIEASFPCLNTFSRAFISEKEGIFNGQYRPRF